MIGPEVYIQAIALGFVISGGLVVALYSYLNERYKRRE